MKKYFLTAAVMLAGLVALNADTFKTPRGEPQALFTADYGGVNVATAAFTNAMSTVCYVCKGVYYGVMFSTSATPATFDFVDVFDATSAVTAVAIGAYSRDYNVYGSTGLGITSGFSGPPKPIRFYNGLFFKPNVATYNNIRVLYWSGDDEY